MDLESGGADTKDAPAKPFRGNKLHVYGVLYLSTTTDRTHP